MLIDNGKSIQRHAKTDRPLNLWHDDLTVGCEILQSSAFRKERRSHKIGHAVAVLYKATYKRATYKACEVVESFCIYMCSNPALILRINSASVDLSDHGLKQVLYNLETLELIEVFQGFSHKSGSRQMAIKPTPKLLKLVD